MRISLPMVQLLDSAFPTGSFSHSFGLETAIQEGSVRDGDELFQWLVSYVRGNVVPMDGAGVYLTYQYMSDCGMRILPKHQSDIKELDRRITVSRLPRESREGSEKIARRWIKTLRAIYPKAGLDEYSEWILKKECFGHSAVIHGMISRYLQENWQSAVLTYLYASVNNLLQNAVRAMAIGQTEGQIRLHAILSVLQDEVVSLEKNPPTLRSLSTQTLHQEIEAMRHELLYSRLFMS